jgi:hypothetical protein
VIDIPGGGRRSKQCAILDKLSILWHMRGSGRIAADQSNEAVLQRLEAMLDRQRKPIIFPDYPNVNKLTFDDPLWSHLMWPNWLAMVIFDRGEFWIEEENGNRAVRYQLRSLHLLLLCVFAAVTFTLAGLHSNGPLGGLKFGAMAFGWLYGVNILLAILRVPFKIQSAIQG